MAENSFKENFWNYELGNFSGYETLLKKLKDGQKYTKDYLEYLKLRIIALEVYGKSLQKLGKISSSKCETGIMGACWMNSVRGTEDLSGEILKAAASMDGEVSHAIDLTRKQRESRKREEDEMKQMQNNLRAAMNKVQTRKRQYEAKMKEKKQAESAVTQMEGTKDAPKAQQRLQQASSQCEVAASNLTQAEQQLEDTRATWEQRTESCFEVFEALEEQRLNCISNLQSVILEIETKRLLAEETLVKLTVEFTEEDVTEELATFVVKSRTDEQPPPCIKPSITDDDDFDDFDSDDNDKLYDTIQLPNTISRIQNAVENKVDMASIKGKFFSLLPARKKEMKTATCKDESFTFERNSAQEPKEDKMISNALYATSSDVADSLAAVTYDFQNPEPNAEQDDEDTMSVGSYKGAGSVMRVTYSYNAKHASDVSLSEGQLVTLVQIVDNEWAEVKASGDKHGYFPRAYLEPADS